jgi:hypothetical protein
MKLKFFVANDIASKAKATIHQTGKLGFSNEAISYLQIKEDVYIKFAQNEEDASDLNLYAVLTNQVTEECFKISKAGKYYYVNTKGLFDSIGVNYKETKILYDITKIEIEGVSMIKLIRREIKKKKKEVADK